MKRRTSQQRSLVACSRNTEMLFKYVRNHNHTTLTLGVAFERMLHHLCKNIGYLILFLIILLRGASIADVVSMWHILDARLPAISQSPIGVKSARPERLP
jgi:hypothetical protein